MDTASSPREPGRRGRRAAGLPPHRARRLGGNGARASRGFNTDRQAYSRGSPHPSRFRYLLGPRQRALFRLGAGFRLLRRAGRRRATAAGVGRPRRDGGRGGGIPRVRRAGLQPGQLGQSKPHCHGSIPRGYARSRARPAEPCSRDVRQRPGACPYVQKPGMGALHAGRLGPGVRRAGLHRPVHDRPAGHHHGPHRGTAQVHRPALDPP